MKRIIKNKPSWFDNWIRNFIATNGFAPSYKNEFAPDTEDGYNNRNRLRKALIEEQGGICCYCMSRINDNNSHNEHYYPESKYPDLVLDYNNIFASCNGCYNPIAYDYCGKKKDDWVPSTKIELTSQMIEKIFSYSFNGLILPNKKHNFSVEADEYIEKLNLNSPILRRCREEAISATELYDESVDISDKQIIWDLIEYYSERNEDNQFIPYCMAIVDCFMLYV